LSAPVVIDPLATYRRSAGPALVARGAGAMSIVAIDDGGNVRFANGILLARLLTSWAPAVTAPTAVTLEPAVRPALVTPCRELMSPRDSNAVRSARRLSSEAITTPTGLVVLVVGTDGLLHSAEIGFIAPFFQPLTPVDAARTVSARGPVALLATASNLVAIDTDRTLRAAFRAIAPGSPWTSFDAIDRDVPVSPSAARAPCWSVRLPASPPCCLTGGRVGRSSSGIPGGCRCGGA
jgi:hypothetical protein